MGLHILRLSIAAQKTVLSAMLAAVFLAGCYSSAGHEGHPDGGDDQGIGGDSLPDGRRDGADSSPDGVPDGSPDVLPDVFPDSQPADFIDPEWPEYDLPEIGEDTPVAEPVGPPIPIDDVIHAGGPPSVAWNGSGWGVVWGDMATPIVFRPLDAMASPVGPAVILDYSLNYLYAQIEWHIDHYGVVGSQRSYNVGFITIDPEGAPLFGPTLVAEHAANPDLAWSQQAGGWLVGYVSTDYSDLRIFAALLDDQANLLGEPRAVGTGDTSRGPRIVGLKSRNAFFWHRGDGIWHRSFWWPQVDAGTTEQMIMSLPGIEDTRIEVAAFLDFAFAVGMDGRDVLVEVVEPWMGSVISGPNDIGQSGIIDRRPDIIAVVARGYLGVCYETGPGPAGGSPGNQDGLDFRIISDFRRVAIE